jgi:hypothetical protein
VSLKKLSTVAAAALVVAGLAACSDNHGAAALVSDTRIADNTITKYVTKEGPDADKANQVSPRVFVLDQLIPQEIFTQALERTGGVPTDAELAALHDDAISTLLQVSPQDYEKNLAAEIKAYGLAPSVAELNVHQLELEWAYIMRTKVSNPTELNAELAKLKIPVTVNASYGDWDAASLRLNTDSSAGRPAFVTFNTPASTTAAAAS